MSCPLVTNETKNKTSSREETHKKSIRQINAKITIETGKNAREFGRAFIDSYFQQWNHSGITERMVERGLRSGGETNRFVIEVKSCFMTERKSKSKWGDSKR